jgi:hypothetical protein
MGKMPDKIKILENVKIIYTDGKKDYFEAVDITNEGVFTGRINYNKQFVRGGFIPKNHIEKIEGKKIKLKIEK